MVLTYDLFVSYLCTYVHTMKIQRMVQFAVSKCEILGRLAKWRSQSVQHLRSYDDRAPESRKSTNRSAYAPVNLDDDDEAPSPCGKQT